MTNILSHWKWVFHEINSKDNDIISKTQIIFWSFFHFWYLHQILNILKRKMNLIADFFRKL